MEQVRAGRIQVPNIHISEEKRNGLSKLLSARCETDSGCGSSGKGKKPIPKITRGAPAPGPP